MAQYKSRFVRDKPGNTKHAARAGRQHNDVYRNHGDHLKLRHYYMVCEFISGLWFQQSNSCKQIKIQVTNSK